MEVRVIYRDVEFDVEFDYQPYEPPVYYYRDGSGYPGCAEQADITCVSHKGTDFTDFFFNFGTTAEVTAIAEKFEQLVLEALANMDYGD